MGKDHHPAGRRQEKPLRFLRYFLMANYPVKNEKGESVIYEDRIYDWLTNKENAALAATLPIPSGSSARSPTTSSTTSILSEGAGQQRRQELCHGKPGAAGRKSSSAHYVLLLSVASLPPHLFNHFVSQLESLLFHYIFTKTPTRTWKGKFGAWAGELREIVALGDENAQAAKIDAFVRDRFQTDMNDKAEELSDALRRLALGSMQKYRIEYFLEKTTQYVDLAFRNEKGPASLAPYKKSEIEHILPNNPKKNELRESWKVENPEADYMSQE